MDKKTFLYRMQALVNEFEGKNKGSDKVAIDVQFNGNRGKFAWNGERLVEVKEDFALENAI